MRKPPTSRTRKRLPLTHARVIDAALSLADAKGIEALTLRAVAATLGVEAMSLYKHVANKDAILDGLVERVFAEMKLPAANLGWRSFLFQRACDARVVLLRHPWAPMLIESRTTPSPARLHVNNGIVGALRKHGFSIELAYHAFLSIDCYLHGFTLQETWSPCDTEQRVELVESLRPEISAVTYPHLVEMMNFVEQRAMRDVRTPGAANAASTGDFEFGLNLLLDGLEKAAKKTSAR